MAADRLRSGFAAHGFPMSEFSRLGIGPVITRDAIEYHRELRMLDPYVVDTRLGGLSEDGARWVLVNTFARPDGKRVAVVTSHGGWLDLKARKIVPPPAELAAALAQLPRTEPFETLATPAR